MRLIDGPHYFSESAGRRAGPLFCCFYHYILGRISISTKKLKKKSGEYREASLYKHMYTSSYRIKTIEESKQIYTRRSAMKGYLNEDGYMGFVNGRYILFASEAEYEEYMMED